MIHEYQTGRAVCGFIEFVSWVIAALALFLLIDSLDTASSRGHAINLIALLNIAPLMGLMLLCVLIVVIIQIARGSMDGSVAGQKAVIQAEKHHQEILRSFRELAHSAPPLSDIAKKADASPTKEGEQVQAAKQAEGREVSRKTLEYNGVKIAETESGDFVVYGKTFKSLASAEFFVEFTQKNKTPEGLETQADGDFGGRTFQDDAVKA